METTKRSGRNMVWIGDFFGNIADSPSGAFSIAWGGDIAKSSMGDKQYRLISGGRVGLAGKANNRILAARVSDGGFFALDTITPNNTAILLVLRPDGEVLFKRQSDKSFRCFGISPDGAYVSWIAENRAIVWDVVSSRSLADFELPGRVYPEEVSYTRGEGFVWIRHYKLGLYRFALDGTFIDEEKWLDDYLAECDGNALYHTVREYYERIAEPTADDCRTYALWVKEALRRGVKEAFMFSLSGVYDYLASLWEKAGDPSQRDEALAQAEEHLDGFRLVDRAVSRVSEIGTPPNLEIASRLLSDLDRATKTEKLGEYPNYIGKLFRTKGEILEAIGDLEGAASAYRKALEGNPKAGCKKQLERLTNSPVVLPEKPKPKPIEERLRLDRLTMFHFRCPVCGSTPQEIPFQNYLGGWRDAAPQRLKELFLHLSEATRGIRFGQAQRLTKKCKGRADALVQTLVEEGKDEGSIPAPFLVDAADKNLTMLTQCPICLHGPGMRSKDNYFKTWEGACGVQSSNLYYEAGLILFGLCASGFSWVTDEKRVFCQRVKTLCFSTGESIGLSSCPQCGRFTTCLYGGERNNPEKGMCRWCLDTSGGSQI